MLVQLQLEHFNGGGEEIGSFPLQLEVFSLADQIAQELLLHVKSGFELLDLLL